PGQHGRSGPVRRHRSGARPPQRPDRLRAAPAPGSPSLVRRSRGTPPPRVTSRVPAASGPEARVRRGGVGYALRSIRNHTSDLWPAPLASTAVDADLRVPGSKSITNRALVLAALADGP